MRNRTEHGIYNCYFHSLHTSQNLTLICSYYFITSLQFHLSSITPSFLPSFASQLLPQENDETFNFRF
ncbi:hypothetical protein P8452_24431 [Trifolium repens]|nr:hypothetical protein P8452_24431 [Trifolium repens]